ncbi:MAG: hypothetical protein ABI488_25310 [Polyangiaceae bacterium]
MLTTPAYPKPARARDYARDLAFGSAPPAPLPRTGADRVVYIRSLTKSIAPGLRIAGIVAKDPVLGRLRALRAKERCDVAVRALALHLPRARLGRVPEGGFSLWLELPSGLDDLEFVPAAASAGVSLTPGAPWFAAGKPGAFVRISTAGASAGDLELGIARLARVAEPTATREAPG